VLRPHELFQQPVQVDLNKSVEIEVPDAWKREIKNGPINVLPLVGGSKQQYRDGWCTYTYEHVQAPELEIVCGGINAKGIGDLETRPSNAFWIRAGSR
jgi:hypothetical protein